IKRSGGQDSRNSSSGQDWRKQLVPSFVNGERDQPSREQTILAIGRARCVGKENGPKFLEFRCMPKSVAVAQRPDLGKNAEGVKRRRGSKPSVLNPDSLR